MEMKEFIQNFADQFDEIEVAELTPATEFRTLDGWSSLVALSIIAMIDDEYEVTLKGADIQAAKTIEDLYNIVSSKM